MSDALQNGRDPVDIPTKLHGELGSARLGAILNIKEHFVRNDIIRSELSDLASQPGLEACALAEIDSGLALQTAGTTVLPDTAWEAAVDFWRAHVRRKSHFSTLGDLKAIALYHAAHMLVILPCRTQTDLIVICAAARTGVDWGAWQRLVVNMDQRLKKLQEEQLDRLRSRRVDD